MNDNAAGTADILEMLQLNQAAIRAAIEELSLWITQRGSVKVHENVMAALATLDIHSEAISLGILKLRG